MKNFIGNMIMLMAGFVVLLHALVPHKHEQSISATEHQAMHNSADTFLEIIALSFHESHDQGSLDNFDVEAEQPPINADLSFSPLLVSILSQTVCDENIIPYDINNVYVLPTQQKVPLPQLANRPPPSII